jgi:hypothetical protein
MYTNQRATKQATPHGHRIVRALSALCLLLVLALAVCAVMVGAGWYVGQRYSSYHDVDSNLLLDAVKQIAYSSLGESPHIESNPPSGAVPICRDVPEQLIKPLRRAFGLMRGTPEGQRLFNVLVDSDVCVTIDDLTYNAAYAESRQSRPNDWSTSLIVVDRSLVRSSMTDTLAAVLIHEATHIDRAVSGQACFVDDRCDRLPNGVEIEEEIAAHTAEAEWWIAAFGSDGKRFAFRSDYGENRLVRKYLQGDASFRAYITAYRSDPREGAGI